MVNKRELLESMWDKVADIRDGMSEIEENIYTISDCIDAKKFFAPEAAETVMKNLDKIEQASAFCKDNYESLSGEEFSFEEIESLEKSLREIDILLNNQEEVEAAKRFLGLSCADEIARPYLIEEQEKLAGILGDEDSFTVARDLERLAGLRPYARYLKAFDEKRMVSVLDYIAELRERFHDELVAALLDKQISENAPAPADEPEIAEPEIAETEIEAPAADAEADEPEIAEPEIEAPVLDDDADEPEITEPEIEAPAADAETDEPEIAEPEIEMPVLDIDADEPDIAIPVDSDEDEPEISIPVDSEVEPEIEAPAEEQKWEPEVSFLFRSDDASDAAPAPADEAEPEDSWSIPVDAAEDAAEAVADVAEDVAEAADTVAETVTEEKPKESTGFFGRWF